MLAANVRLVMCEFHEPWETAGPHLHDAQPTLLQLLAGSSVRTRLGPGALCAALEDEFSLDVCLRCRAVNLPRIAL